MTTGTSVRSTELSILTPGASAAHGLPTFAIDLIGAGSSSHPPSTQITNEVTAFVAHQIVQGLRTGNVNGFPLGLLVPLAKVILMGHSLGSLTVWQETISFGDVEGVIVSGSAHFLTAKFLASASVLYPAVDDPSSPTAIWIRATSPQCREHGEPCFSRRQMRSGSDRRG